MTEYHKVNYKNLTLKQQERRLRYLNRIKELDVKLGYLPSIDLLTEIDYIKNKIEERRMRI